MSLERHYSLSQAAKAIGVDRDTLKRWLAADLAMVMPDLPKGSKMQIPERHIEAVLRNRRPSSDKKLIRRQRTA